MKVITSIILLLVSISLISCEEDEGKKQNENEGIFEEIEEFFEGVFEESYTSPGGEEHMRFNIQVRNGKIESVSAQGVNTENPISQEKQAAFIKALSGAVVGKTIKEVQTIEEIADAPLSTQAFQKALEELLESQ